MFDFLSMMDNYDDRKVGRYEDDIVTISTARVYDSLSPYETAVAHPNYNGGDFVIVAVYDTLEEAIDGHGEWIRTMVDGPLPDRLIDVSQAGIALLVDMVNPEEWREHEDETLNIWPDVWNLTLDDEEEGYD